MSLIEYSYDAVGNRTQKVEEGVTTTYEYDAANQLVSSQTGSSTTIYAYDLNGNLLSETNGSSVTSYEWDEENRLTKVTSPDGSRESYTYSADGLRKKKVVTTASTTDTTLFLWDGQNILLETDENRVIKARYTNPPEGYGPLLSMKHSATSLRYGFDTQSNARVLVGSSQSINDNYSYSGFGDEFSSSGTTVNPHRFGGEVGYYRDQPQRVYVRARHYRSQLGRWMSDDPIGYDGGDYNLYRYVSNNPIEHVDPSGLVAPAVIIAACGISCGCMGGMVASCVSDANRWPAGQRADAFLRCMGDTWNGLAPWAKAVVGVCYGGCIACAVAAIRCAAKPKQPPRKPPKRVCTLTQSVPPNTLLNPSTKCRKCTYSCVGEVVGGGGFITRYMYPTCIALPIPVVPGVMNPLACDAAVAAGKKLWNIIEGG